jgi:hypothetical protein
MGFLGRRGLARAARVCRAWNEAASAKVQEWSVASHQRVTGNGVSRYGAVVEMSNGEGSNNDIIVVEEDYRQLHIKPPVGPPLRVIDSLIAPDETTKLIRGSIDAKALSGAPLRKGRPRAGQPSFSEVLLSSMYESRQYDELLAGKPTGLPLRAFTLGGLATDDGGSTVLLGLSRQGGIVESLGFHGKVVRKPRSGCIVRVRVSDGALLHASAPPHTPDALLQKPAGLAIAGDRIYVCDADADCVLALDAASLQPPHGVMALKEIKLGEGRLSKPQDAAASPELDELFVCDTAHHRLVVFSTCSPYEVTRTIGTCTESERRTKRIPGTFSEPVGVCVTQWRILVGEAGNRRLQILSREGEPLQVLKLPGEKPLRGISLGPQQAFGPAHRLWANESQGRLHIIHIGRSALAPP